MPRIARPVFPGIPHHITQRGNRRENVFFTEGDRTAYLRWLADYCVKFDVRVLAYCLMTNHVHLVAVPETSDSLEHVFRPLHTRYAQRINRAKGWTGHLWQGRFFSSALDDIYLWAAIRYVERNPVRAGMVRRAEDYRWSSAPAHCETRDDYVLTIDRSWLDQLRSIDDWSGWLAEPDASESITMLRQNVKRGLPCGTDEFVNGLELQVGQALRPTAVGRPKKGEFEAAG
ncbi:MAG: transposase [Betaproteobacteria bacterium]